MQNARQSNKNAAEALKWLDYITTLTENRQAGKVKLQEPEDRYRTWQEVEQHLVPPSLLSASPEAENGAGLSAEFEQRLGLNDVVHIGPAKNHTTDAPVNMSSTNFAGQGAQVNGSALHKNRVMQSPDEKSKKPVTISTDIQDLLNYVVWRTQNAGQQPFYSATYSPTHVSHYILLTDDRELQKQVGKYGVKAKLLSQLKRTVSKFPNRRASAPSYERPMHFSNGNQDENDAAIIEDEDEHIVFDPTQRPGSAHQPKLIDPDQFERRGNGNYRVRSRAQGRQHRGPFRGTRGVDQTSPRQAPNSNRPTSKGPETSTPTHGSPVFQQAVPVQPSVDGVNSPRGGSMRGRGSGRSGRGRGPANGRQHRGEHVPRPMDPDSYARPRGRGRGDYRKLWEPS